MQASVRKGNAESGKHVMIVKE